MMIGTLRSKHRDDCRASQQKRSSMGQCSWSSSKKVRGSSRGSVIVGSFALLLEGPDTNGQAFVTGPGTRYQWGSFVTDGGRARRGRVQLDDAREAVERLEKLSEAYPHTPRVWTGLAEALVATTEERA